MSDQCGARQKAKTNAIVWNLYGVRMEYVWNSYGTPMELLWNNMGTTP
jgi:hypothetical protein